MRRTWLVLIAAIACASVLAAPASAGESDDDSLRRRGSETEMDAVELLAYVPTSQRYVCGQITPDGTNSLPQVVAEANAISAAVICNDPLVGGVTYLQFSDASAMNRAYLQTVTRGSTGAAGSDCPENGLWGFNDGTDGRIVCYLGTLRGDTPIAGTATRVWTDDRNNILAIAALPDGDADFAKLRTWWNEEAGPIKDADDTGFVTETDADDVDDLLASIPKSTRRSCEEIDREDAVANVGEQLVIAAAVFCANPAKGVEEVWYYAIDPDVIEELLASPARSVTQEELDATDEDAICPTFGTWSQGKGKDKREVGSYSCYFVETPTGDNPVWNWTDTEQGILGSAEAGDEDPTRVHEWWQSNASGPIQP